MSAKIHPTAVIDSTAEISEGVEIGPYCIVGPKVTIGEGSILQANAQILEHTTMGKNNLVSSFAVIGGAPQDESYKGEPTEIFIGDNNVIREYVTINRGTMKDNGKTIIGNDNLFMTHSHVAHDNIIGNHCALANLTQLAGHVVMEDHVVTSGAVLVHQFTTVGERCFLAPRATVASDALPGCVYFGHPAEARSLNLVGLKRAGLGKDELRHMKNAFKLILRSEMSGMEAVAEIEKEEWANEPMIRKFLNAVKAKKQGIKGRAVQ